MLRAPHTVSRKPPEETACFISENGQVVVLTGILASPPKSYGLAGRVLTIHDDAGRPFHQRFAIGDRALAHLRIGSELIVAEIDDDGPVRTTSGIELYRRRERE